MQPSFLIENNFDTNLLAGIDEVGRGCIAGPVVACCVMLNKNINIENINDSKKISKKLRNNLYEYLTKNCNYGIGIIDQNIIDEINILQATKLAMLKAYENLTINHKIFPEILLVDGNTKPFPSINNIKTILPIIKGDQKSYTIACASIIAKVYRDNLMQEYHKLYPHYEFNKHMGYGTSIHIKNIHKNGICEIHRKTFEPIKSIINANY
jgi:ribonuclease HII